MIFSGHSSEADFTAMIREHLPMFRGLSRRILFVSADVDDAIQNALLQAWRRRGSFRGEAQLAHWVARIVINESYNLLRKRQREQTSLAEYSPATPEDSKHQEVQLHRLEDAIAKLPPLYRETVHLALLSDFDRETAAKMLGCTTNTLYQRIHQAKKLLRKKLDYEQP